MALALDTLTVKIKPLSRFEKVRLIEIISRMLVEEEKGSDFATYPIETPYHQEKAAVQLQQFLNELTP